MRLFDHPFHAGPTGRTQVLGRVRCIAHGDERIDVEHCGEIGIILNMTTGHRVSGRIDQAFCAEPAVVNSVTVMPPGRRFRFAIEGKCRVLALMLPIGGLDEEMIRRSVVRPRVNAVDTALARLVWRTATATNEARPEALLDLATYLYKPLGEQSGRITGGVPPARLRRVIDGIEDGISGPLPLAYLAHIAGMSSFHFARAFAASTGSPPHQYVVARRIARAVSELGKDRSIDEVADRCGFSSASHLGYHMRDMLGTTPGRLRVLAT